MKQEVGEGKELKVEYLLVDLASFSSVKDFVKTFREKNLPLHILVNNAAVCGTPFSKNILVCPLGIFKVIDISYPQQRLMMAWTFSSR